MATKGDVEMGHAVGYAPPPVSAQPIPGMAIKPPLVPPQPGQTIIGYQVTKPQTGCCKCEGMTQGGLIALIVLVLMFAPLAWIPCCMPSCFEDQQRPVYGNPQGPNAYPVAPPATAQA